MWLFVAGRAFEVVPIPDPEPLYSEGPRFRIVGASAADLPDYDEVILWGAPVQAQPTTPEMAADLAAIDQTDLRGVLVRPSGQGRLRLTPIETLSKPFGDDDGTVAICMWLFRERSRRVSGRDPAAAFQKWADRLVDGGIGGTV